MLIGCSLNCFKLLPQFYLQASQSFSFYLKRLWTYPRHLRAPVLSKTWSRPTPRSLDGTGGTFGGILHLEIRCLVRYIISISLSNWFILLIITLLIVGHTVSCCGRLPHLQPSPSPGFLTKKYLILSPGVVILASKVGLLVSPQVCKFFLVIIFNSIGIVFQKKLS